MPTINGDNTTTQTITGSNQTWILAASATILASGSNHGMVDDASLHDNTVEINGLIRADAVSGAAGIVMQGANATVRVSETGLISSFNGIIALGANATVENRGVVSASTGGGNGAGILINDAGSAFTNSGLVMANIAVSAPNGGSIINEEGGRIVGYLAPIQIGSTAAGDVTNHGLITKTGGGTAVETYSFADTVKNDGVIDGDVRLGGAGDTFDNRGGEVRGLIYGGDGDDTLFVDNAAYVLTENDGEGYDTIRSTVSYVLPDFVEMLVLIGKAKSNATGNDGDNLIRGNAGKNTLVGLDGSDTLDGGKGNDRLTGGTEGDEFIYHPKSGVDTITDFQDGDDRIAILGFNDIGDFEDLAPHIKQKGDDVWIVFGKQDRLVVLNADSGALDGADFDFTS